MKFDKIKKIGLLAGVIAVLGATGVLNKAEFEINNLSYEVFQVSPLGSDVEYRSEAIMHDFNTIIKNKVLTAEANQEVEQIRKIIQSAEYKENLKDAKFFENERFFGVGRLNELIGKTETPLADFNERLKKDGWNLEQQSNNEIKVEKASIDFTNSNSSISEQKSNTYGFFQEKIGLEAYAQERRMGEPFKPFDSLEAKNNIQKLRESAQEPKNISKQKLIKS